MEKGKTGYKPRLYLVNGKLKKVENRKVKNKLQTQIVPCKWKVENRATKTQIMACNSVLRVIRFC
jgi:hypothetical protein